MSTLNERLAESLRLSREARARQEAAEQQEARLALSQESDPETEAMDAESDARVEEMLITDARDLERAKLAATAVLRLWAQASPDARRLALTALLHSVTLSRDAASLTHGPAPKDLGDHMCTDVHMVCSYCLREPVVPERARDLAVRLSQAPPLSWEDQVELSADGFLDRLLSRARFQPDFRPGTGALDVKLANLLREK